MAKFFFLIQKLAMISCQCRIIVVLLAVLSMRAHPAERERLRRDYRSFRTWKYLRVLLQKASFTFAYNHPVPTFLSSSKLSPSTRFFRPRFFCPIPSWIIRLSKIFTEKNTGKKGRISVIFPSSSFWQIFQFQRQIFWLFKNEITHDESIIRVN